MKDERAMPVVKTSSKGQVVIPREIRKKIGLEPGDKVLVVLTPAGKVTIEPVPDDPIAAARGMLRGGPSLTAALLKEKKGEHAREEAKGPRLLRAHRVPRRRKGIRKG
jgi:AbrB family looped-hinge helix DNA binding protein